MDLGGVCWVWGSRRLFLAPQRELRVGTRSWRDKWLVRIVARQEELLSEGLYREEQWVSNPELGEPITPQGYASTSLDIQLGEEHKNRTGKIH